MGEMGHYRPRMRGSTKSCGRMPTSRCPLFTRLLGLVWPGPGLAIVGTAGRRCDAGYEFCRGLKKKSDKRQTPLARRKSKSLRLDTATRLNADILLCSVRLQSLLAPSQRWRRAGNFDDGVLASTPPRTLASTRLSAIR